MYIDNQHTRFLQKEEKFIISTLAEIAYTKSPSDDEARLLEKTLSIFLDKNLELYNDLWGEVLDLIKKNRFALPRSMTTATNSRWYQGMGNGKYDSLNKRTKDSPEDVEENFAKNLADRATRRAKQWREAEGLFKDKYEETSEITDNEPDAREKDAMLQALTRIVNSMREDQKSAQERDELFRQEILTRIEALESRLPAGQRRSQEAIDLAARIKNRMRS